MSGNQQTSTPRTFISAEGSELLMELFNRAPIETLKAVPEPLRKRISKFMVDNGYRFVFDRWWLQAEPKGTDDADALKQLYADAARYRWIKAQASSAEIATAAERNLDIAMNAQKVTP